MVEVGLWRDRKVLKEESGWRPKTEDGGRRTERWWWWWKALPELQYVCLPLPEVNKSDGVETCCRLVSGEHEELFTWRYRVPCGNHLTGALDKSELMWQCLKHDFVCSVITPKFFKLFPLLNLYGSQFRSRRSSPITNYSMISESQQTTNAPLYTCPPVNRIYSSLADTNR